MFKEFNVVEKPIIDWLVKTDWKFVPANELKRELEDPFDFQTLKESLKRLNPDVIESEEEIEKVVNKLLRLPNDITGNREFFEWLKGEKSLILEHGEKAQTVRLIDFDNLENNSFIVTRQFVYIGYATVRFDIVLMINGIPLVVIEAKPPAGDKDYREGIRQLFRYHREAPQIIKYLAFVCATDGIIFRYDWYYRNKYFEWKEKSKGDPLKIAIDGLFNKKQFLDILENFIVFEKERDTIIKKIAMYPQICATNEIIKRVLKGQPRTGLIWHWMGAGKTLTMLFCAWKLKRISQLHNPTILVVVDRIDLDKQLGGTFENVDLPYTARADSIKALKEKLKQDSREVIVTTVQKFRGIEEILNKRENIIIFVDEAHRTQYGKLAAYMRQAIPKAFIFGFTGTPIDKGPLGKSTFRVFCPEGERYLDKYSIKQSIDDKAIVPIFYLPRLTKYHIPKEKLDKEFFKITESLSEEEQQKILRKSATFRNILKSKDRIEKIAEDVAKHYKEYIEPLGFKAQLVAVDREACALYKEALDKHLKKEESAVIYTPAQNDKPLLKKYHLPKHEQVEISRNKFQKTTENPKILIVTNMLLTGFDAPIEQVMYLDKPLRDHTLLQAIARTNRLYEGKIGGLIVDYIGIFDNLKKALNFEEEDIRGVAFNFDDLKKRFERAIKEALDIFKGVKKAGTRESLLKTMAVLRSEKKAKHFKEKYREVKKLYEAVAPDPFLVKYLSDYQWLTEINSAYNRFYKREEEDFREYQAKTKQLIQEKLLLKNIQKSIPLLKIDKDYLKNLEKSGYSDDLKIAEMKQALEYHIRINLEINPVYETLAQRLERIIKIIDKTHLFKELKNLVRETSKIETEAGRLGLTNEEYVLLNVFRKYSKLDEKELIDFTKKVIIQTKKTIFPGWQKKSSVIREVEQKIFEVCLEKFLKELRTTQISDMSDELLKFIKKHNP